MMSVATASIEAGQRARREGRSTDAARAFRDAIAAAQATDDAAALARARVGLGQIERDLGRRDAALREYEAAVAVLRTLDEPLALAHAIRHAGDILSEMGRVEAATECYEEALATYRSRPDAPALDLANALRGFALVSEAVQPHRAAASWHEARALYAEAGVPAGVAECDAHLAGQRRGTGRP